MLFVIRISSRKAIAAISLFLVSACATQSIENVDYRQTQPVIQMTTSGVGPVGAGTPYSQQSLAAALPGFEMGTVKTISQGQLKHLQTAFKGGMQQLQFEPNASGRLVSRIHLVGQEAAGPNGERIGMTFREAGGIRQNCQPGSNQWSRMALCKSPDGSMTYVFAPQEYDGPENQLPPANVLAEAHLVRIIWEAN